MVYVINRKKHNSWQVLACLVGVFLMLVLLCGCSQSQENVSAADTANSGAATPDSLVLAVAEADMFSDRDREIGYSDYVTIKLADGASQADGDGVSVAGDTVTISAAGTYLFTGSLSDGQVLVDCGDNDKVTLVLSQADISCSHSAAIYVRQADKVFVILAAETENKLAVTGEYQQTDDNTVDAAIFSKGDLTLNGQGALTIDAAFGHGVVSKDDLVITGGVYTVNAASHGFSGKDSIRIADGSFTITCGKDGLHAANDEDTTLGFIYVAGGSFAIAAEDDGVHSDQYVVIVGGEMDIRQSIEGIEGQSIEIRSGKIALVASDDGLNASSPSTDTTATSAANAGKDSTLAATGNAGIAGDPIAGTTGNAGATGAADPAVAGGKMADGGFGADAACQIILSGGELCINAQGDGIDSNGGIMVSGGSTYVSGPTGSGDGALDYGGEAVISGGVFVAAGSAGMAQGFGSVSLQGSILYVLDTVQRAGTTIVLQAADGTVLAQYAPEKEYQSVVISAPGVNDSGSYTLLVGEQSYAVEMTAITYSNGSGRGGFGGKGQMMQDGTMPDGGTPWDGGTMPDGGTPPEGMTRGERPNQNTQEGVAPANTALPEQAV